MHDRQRRTEYEATLLARREAQIKEAKRSLEVARERLEDAQDVVDRAQAFLGALMSDPPLHMLQPVVPNEKLASACAAIVSASRDRWALSYYAASQRGFLPLTGAALATTLNDAVMLGWVQEAGEGRVNLMVEDCELTRIAAGFESCTRLPKVDVPTEKLSLFRRGGK